jgi:RNA polymerase sigma-70 factor (ECF subfamily)
LLKETAQYEEKALLALVAKGDENAFQTLFTQYRHKVFYIAKKLLQSDSLAEDALQEIFLKIWMNRTKLPDVLYFNAYLNTITRNHIYNALRKQANEEIFLQRLVSQDNTPDQTSALDTLSLRELQHALQRVVASLTPQQRKAFELSRIQGLRHGEIATLLNISKETVKKHISDALRIIRQQMTTHHRFTNLSLLLLLYHF